MRVVVRKLTHRYSRRATAPVLNNINLVVEQGETVALMAPSGAGKSTLLSIMGGLLTPSEGSITWDDGTLHGVVDQRVGWIFQTVNVLGARTVLDNVAIGLLGQNVARQEANRLASEALRSVGLVDKAARRAQTLSGGEVQRVVVARALVGRRQLVFADEPTGQLDASTTAGVLDAIFQSRATTTTLIVASHDQRVADRCDRLLRIVDGTLVEDSTRASC